MLRCELIFFIILRRRRKKIIYLGFYMANYQN
jgi:hypothetical protein